MATYYFLVRMETGAAEDVAAFLKAVQGNQADTSLVELPEEWGSWNGALAKAAADAHQPDDEDGGG